MASEEYRNYIARDVKAPEPPRQYTKQEKLANWWYYHRKAVLGVAAVLLLVVLATLGQPRQKPADYTVTILCSMAPPEGFRTQAEEALSALADDRNGDGQCVVRVQLLEWSMEEMPQTGYAMQAAQAAQAILAADLEKATSCIFLTAQPQAFQTWCQGYLYLDGTAPDEEAEDWQNMVYAVTDCPALARLAELQPEPLYLGRRAPRTEAQRKALEGTDALWEAFAAGAPRK